MKICWTTRIILGGLLIASCGYGQGFGDGGASTGGEASGSTNRVSQSSNNASGGSSSSAVGVIVGENYVLKPSDIITLEVFQEPELKKDVRIEGDGTVALALIGNVKVAGMTVAEAQSLITELYDRDYLVEPQVSILVLNFSPKIVHVLGQVNAPGVVTIPPDRDLSLTEAIAAVRGVNRLGNPKSITIKRLDGDGRALQMEVNFNRILTDPDAKDIKLKEGDTVFVPERII